MFISIWKDPSTPQQTHPHSHQVTTACHSCISCTDSLYSFPSWQQIPLTSITLLCCNTHTTLALSSEGLVYIWGSTSSAILQTPCSSPSQISKLQSIIHIAISNNHAAAIDEAGLLFTWGCPLFGKLGYPGIESSASPELVSSSRAFKSIQVVCGEKHTSVLSDGGFIHIYGDIGKCNESTFKSVELRNSKVNRPYSHPELDKYSAISISGGRDFIAVTTETGEVFALDGCMDLVKLPTHTESKVTEIVAVEGSVWGISANFLIRWGSEARVRIGCKLAGWSAQVFEAEEDLKIWKWGDGFMINSKSENPLNHQLHEIAPYKRSEYARRLFNGTLESPMMSLKKENRVPDMSFDDLERLFPARDSNQTLEKIIKCRVDHRKFEVILNAFKPIVHPIVIETFVRIKEHGWVVKIFKHTKAVSAIFSAFNSLYRKREIIMKSRFFVRMKALSRLEVILADPVNRKVIIKSCEVLRDQTQSVVKSAYFALRIVNNPKYRSLESITKIIRNQIEVCAKCSLDKWKLFNSYASVKEKGARKLILSIIRIFLNSPFTALQKNSQRQHLFVLHLKKISHALKTRLKLSLSSAFHQIKSNNMNNILLKFHRKYVIEVFIKLLTSHMQSHIHSSLNYSFFTLKSLSKPMSPILILAQMLELKSSKIHRIVLNQILSKSTSNPLTPIISLTLSLSRSVLSNILIESRASIIKHCISFTLLLNKIFSKSYFIHKLKVFNILRQRCLSRSHSLKTEEDLRYQFIDSASDASKPSDSHMNFDPIFSSANPSVYRQARSASSPMAIRRSHKCWTSVNSPTNFQSGLPLTKIYKGEKMTYEKFLILKKIEEINEPSIQTRSPILTPKKRKTNIEKPPWKPASCYSGTSLEKKGESAIKKGFIYNEMLRKRLMKQRYSGELSESQQTCVMHEKGLIVRQDREMKSTVANIVSLPLSGGTLNIGLGSMILGRVMKKINKRDQETLFQWNSKVIKCSAKIPAPIPNDSPKLAVQNTLTIIKNSWQVGVILIGCDKTWSFIRTKAGRILFDALLSN